MPHSRSASDISEPESIISFNEDVYLAMQNAEIPTATFMERARRIIDNLETKEERWIKTPASVNDVEASKVLDAMITHARETGGESSERYTACAICTCPEIHEQVDLARTWFMYLLWPFTAGSHHPVDLISEHATPTIEDTLGSLVSANRERRSGFRNDVIRRDGYRCIVTGLWDGEHIPPGVDQGWVTLIGAHILKRAVGVFTMERAHTAAATWNIIRHYSGMSEATVQSMERLVDDPSNGIMLESNVHTVFDKLKVYLERKPERANEYTVREVGGRAWLHPRTLLNNTVTFQNHAAPGRDLPLPNPQFIALHAGLSKILHMSGAAEVFDQILDRYDRAAGGNSGSLKSNGDMVHQLSSMMSALYIGEGVPLIS